GEQARREGGWASLAAHEEELRQAWERLAGVMAEVGELHAACESARQEMQQAQSRCRGQEEEVARLSGGVSETERRLDALREEDRRLQDELFQLMNQEGKWHNEAVDYRAQLNTQLHLRDRLRQKTEE